MTKSRRETILELIKSNDIEPQEELQNLLEKNGFETTQSTISRDIKHLNIVKVSKNGRYCYALSGGSDTLNANERNRFKDIFSKSVVSIKSAQNDIVIKCYSGMAQAACASVDAIFSDSIVGSLAGDDTIFIITENENKAKELVTKLNGLI
ncbi:MAG: arginine repressor [Oscillospiraceae bacterium]|nr:arginine repressor [Candidatus Equicaccousia limihippi]